MRRSASMAGDTRALARLCWFLAVGGFAEEAAPLLARALARRGDLLAEAKMATPDQIRALVNAEALSLIVTLWSGGGTVAMPAGGSRPRPG